jgi:hypothetical protein
MLARARAGLLQVQIRMAQESAVRPWVRASNLRSRDRPDLATDCGERGDPQRQQCRDDGGRALRAVFSSHDIWLDLGEVEREEWRGYFDRMLKWLHHFGYTPERNPCSMLLDGPTNSTEALNEEAP